MTWLLLAEAGVPEGGLFDLDATLPLMAVQVVLLTFLLNSLFFRPVGKVVEDREGYISTSRAEAKQKLAQVERLEADLTEQLRSARQAAQAAIVEAEQEVDRLYREALAEAEAEANRTREQARREIESQREQASAQLMAQVDQLSSHGSLMMTFSLLFASEGFGINLNLFETNLINLVIVIGVLGWFLKGFLGGILERRRQAILHDLDDAETRLKKATADLAKAQADLAAAQQKAATILADGKARAEAIRLDGEKRTISAMAALKQDALSELTAEGARLSEQLRREAAMAAIDKVMAELPGRLDANGQARLIDASIANLEDA
jgi:F-type H+-transporting ATPase subunit b